MLNPYAWFKRLIEDYLNPEIRVCKGIRWILQGPNLFSSLLLFPLPADCLRSSPYLNAAGLAQHPCPTRSRAAARWELWQQHWRDDGKEK